MSCVTPQLLHNELVSDIPLPLKLKLMYQAAKGMHFLHSSGTVPEILFAFGF
jgi:hypothetical protein